MSGPRDPHLQLRRAAGHGPPHQPARPQPRRGPDGRARRADLGAAGRRETPATRGAGRCLRRVVPVRRARAAGAPIRPRRGGLRHAATRRRAAAGGGARGGAGGVVLDRGARVAAGRVAASRARGSPRRARTGRLHPRVQGVPRIDLAIDRRVLIPRPETELLVEVGLRLTSGARVADVGTGSGAVALALKDERPDLRVVGIDVSRRPSKWRAETASASASRLSSLGGSPRPRAYDAVLANLPYVEAGTSLALEIARYEPPGALFAGADGLDLIRRLVARARRSPVRGARGRVRPGRCRRGAARETGFGRS